MPTPATQLKVREDVRAFLISGGLTFIAMAVGLYWKTQWSAPFPRDSTSLVVGCDFLNLWMYGRAAFEGDPGRFYDPVIYNHALSAMVGHGYATQSWSYPPSLLLLAAPFGLLSYMPALLCWMALGLGAFWLAAQRQLGDWRLVAAALVSPAALLCLMPGQSAFLTTAALLTVFACLDRRPMLAGILIGLLTLKPQVGLLLPVMLIASRRWRTFTAASATALTIAAGTALLFGPHIWTVYWKVGIPAQNVVLTDTGIFATHFMPTIFMNAHLAGASYSASMIMQATVSLAAAATVFWAFRYHTDAGPTKLQALFFACSIAATPYLMGYGTLPLSFSAVALLASNELGSGGRRLAQLSYWLLFLQVGLEGLHIPGAALIPCALAVYLALDIADIRLFKSKVAEPIGQRLPLPGSISALEQSP